MGLADGQAWERDYGWIEKEKLRKLQEKENVDNTESIVESEWFKQAMALSGRGPDRDGEPRRRLYTRPNFGISQREKQAAGRLIEAPTEGGRSSCGNSVY